MTGQESDIATRHSLWDVMHRAQLNALCDVMARDGQSATVALGTDAGLVGQARNARSRRARIRNHPLVKRLTRPFRNPIVNRWGKVISLSAVAHALVIWLLAVLFFPAELTNEAIVVNSLITKPAAPIALSESVAIVKADGSQPKTDVISLLNSSAQPSERGLASTRIGGHGGTGGAGGHDGDLFGAARTVQSVVFVIDRSGSMQGRRLIAVKKELTAAVNNLRSTQTFEVMVYNDRVMRLARTHDQHLVLGTRANCRRVLSAMKKVRASGGTAGALAIRTALRTNPELILFLTDGQFAIDIERDIIERNLAGTRIDTVVIDDSGAGATLQKIASRTGGTFRSVQLTP
jgi:hypothetical protein